MGRWKHARSEFVNVCNTTANRMFQLSTSLRKFANTSDGRRVASRASLCLGDLARYDDAAAVRAYDAAHKFATAIEHCRQEDGPRESKLPPLGYADVAVDWMDLPARSDATSEALRRQHRAMEHYRAALNLTPSHGSAHNCIAVVYHVGRDDALQAAGSYLRAATAPDKPFAAAVATLQDVARSVAAVVPLPEDLHPSADPSSGDLSSLSEDAGLTYARFGAVVVRLLAATANGESSLPGHEAGVALKHVVGRLLQAKITSPAERLFTRVAIASLMAPLVVKHHKLQQRRRRQDQQPHIFLLGRTRPAPSSLPLSTPSCAPRRVVRVQVVD